MVLCTRSYFFPLFFSSCAARRMVSPLGIFWRDRSSLCRLLFFGLFRAADGWALAMQNLLSVSVGRLAFRLERRQSCSHFGSEPQCHFHCLGRGKLSACSV